MAAVGRLLLVILLWQGAVAAAADVTVLASGAIRHALRDVFSEFERATGHKVVPHYEGSLVSRRQMDAGDAFGRELRAGFIAPAPFPHRLPIRRLVADQHEPQHAGPGEEIVCLPRRAMSHRLHGCEVPAVFDK